MFPQVKLIEMHLLRKSHQFLHHKEMEGLSTGIE